MHREDVKAAIRKRHGTLRAFQEANGLPANAVSEVLRGRKSRRTEDAIERLVAEEVGQSINLDDNGSDTIAHCQKAGAR
ncbi:hypothetical protein D9602_01660 [Sphingomonas sp. TX0522]|nr:hypothetical protein [Sphingomonas sp. TX0522]